MIKHISIKNFKSIKEANSDLPLYIGSIVGKNGVGKTNLIQAINFVRSLVIGETTGIALIKFALTPQEALNYNNESLNEMYFGITVTDISEVQYLFEVTLSLIVDATNIQRLIIKNESLKKGDGENLSLVYFREGATFKDSNSNPIPLAVNEDKVAASIYQNNDVLALKNIFSNIFIPDQDAIDFRESIVKSDGKGLASLVVRLRQKDTDSYQKFLKIVKKLLPAFSNFVEIPANPTTDITNTAQKSYMVLLQEENLKDKLSMKSLSAGDLRTLYIVANALYLNQGSTFIYEETENGLHPKRLLDLLEHLDNISRIKQMQILYSTHSPVVINRLRPNEVLYVEKDHASGTKFFLLSDASKVPQIQEILNKGLELTDYLNNR